MKKGKSVEKNHNVKKIIVNIITGLRAIGGLSIIPIYIFFGALPTAIASICFFSTDFIDGMLARKWHVQSFFGALLDGLSDKLFCIVALCILSLNNPIFISVIIGEILIIYINYMSIQRGNNAQSSIVGKIKTMVLAISIVGGLFFYGKSLFNLNPEVVSCILAISELCCTLFVLVDYVKRAKVQDQKRGTKEMDFKKRIKKNKEEILFGLFDTEFYLSNKDNSIKELIYK